MKSMLKILGVVALIMAFMTGCRSAAVYNVQNSSTDLTKKVEEDKIYNAIKQAGLGLGWRVKKVKPGLALAQLNLRSHMAQVEIPYTEKEFSILYKNSMNLDYDQEKGVIHSNYNGWIQNLENAIAVQLSALEM